MGIKNSIMAGLAMALVLGLTPASARELPPQLSNSGPTIRGGSSDQAKAVTDTVLLMGAWGSGALHTGQFEDAAGYPDWNGWTSEDLTQPAANNWHASNNNVVNGMYSAWCGSSDLPACSGDVAGGYGNNWNDPLIWTGVVPVPTS